jgi:20S proteasome alpha/beta subunit
MSNLLDFEIDLDECVDMAEEAMKKAVSDIESEEELIEDWIGGNMEKYEF